MIEVSGSGAAGYDGTYTGIGSFNGEPSWQLNDQAKFLWFDATADLWFLNEERGETSDPGKLAFHQNASDGPYDTYWGYRIAIAGAPTPDCTGNYDYADVVVNTVYYTDTLENWYLWISGGDSKYRITSALTANDGPGDNWWIADVENDPNTTYTAQGTAAGNLTSTTTPDAQCTVQKA